MQTTDLLTCNTLYLCSVFCLLVWKNLNLESPYLTCVHNMLMSWNFTCECQDTCRFWTRGQNTQFPKNIFVTWSSFLSSWQGGSHRPWNRSSTHHALQRDCTPSQLRGCFSVMKQRFGLGNKRTAVTPFLYNIVEPESHWMSHKKDYKNVVLLEREAVMQDSCVLHKLFFFACGDSHSGKGLNKALMDCIFWAHQRPVLPSCAQ